MSLKQRSDAFVAAVVTKNLITAKPFLFADHFKRLVFKRRACELIFSALIIFGGQQFLIQNAFVSPIWPAAAVGLAAIFLRGNFLLVGVFIGSLLSYTVNHLSLGFGLAQSSALVLFLWLTRMTCLHWIGPITPLASIKAWWGFVAIMAGMSFIHIIMFFNIAASAGLVSVTYLTILLGWLGEMNAIICLVPLSLVFEPFVPQRFFSPHNRLWWLVSLLIIGAHFVYYFLPLSTLFYLVPVLFCIIMAMYARCFGQIPTTITLFGLSVIYLGSARGAGSLFHVTLGTTQMLFIFGLLTFTALVSLTIATSTQQKYYKNI